LGNLSFEGKLFFT